MQRIRILPDQVANQIAAGEVVERPASIVKELVENAIDARASRIQVDVEAGGRSLVRVTDDGFGMSREDALLALERHATSKIRKASDLHAIGSMGFRGEALPSIASVSDFALTTREADSPDAAGTRIRIKGGKLLDVQAGTGAPGTCVEVRRLFYNLPARRKFLRTVDTERSHIQQILLTIALAWPGIGFAYRHDGRVHWQLPPLHPGKEGSEAGLLEERWRALNGAAGPMIVLDSEGVLRMRGFGEDPQEEEHAIRLWGILSAPGISRSSRSDIYWFANRRPVASAGLNRALCEGYHTALMKGRHPLACLFLEMPPQLLDVNVHPAKREVRFRNESGVRRLISGSVRARLEEYGPSATPAPSGPVPLRETFPEAPLRQAPLPVPAEREETHMAPVPFRQEPESGEPPAPAAPAPLPPAPPPSVPKKGLLDGPLSAIGILSQLYVLLEGPEGLVVMDQHAAHERVLYEELMGRLEKGPAPSQALLLPETLDLGERDQRFVLDHLQCLARLGVALREEGGGRLVLESLPPFVPLSGARRFVLDVVDELRSSGEGVPSIRLGEDMIARTVCRQAVKANDRLHPREVDRLLDDLRRCRMPYTCPHGRPTLLGITRAELDRRFGRTG